MKYTQYDYANGKSPADGDDMASWWSKHWEGRTALREDLTGEPLWPTIEPVLRKPGLVLEAGCGTGQWAQFLDRRGHTTVGVDYAVSGLYVGKKANAALRLLRGDFRTLSFPDDSFDYVVSFGAVEHDVNGPEAALREFRRVLKPGGWLMCSVPCLNVQRRAALPWLVFRDWMKRREWLRRLANKSDPFVFYQYVWSPGAYRKILAHAGFHVCDLRTYGNLKRSPLARALDRSMSRLMRFYSPHMMMAICQKPENV